MLEVVINILIPTDLVSREYVEQWIISHQTQIKLKLVYYVPIIMFKELYTQRIMFLKHIILLPFNTKKSVKPLIVFLFVLTFRHFLLPFGDQSKFVSG